MFPLAYARDASIKRRRPHSSSTAVSPLTRERSSRHAQCLRPRRHAMLPSMCSQLILASALFAVLTSHMIAAQVEDLPPFEELKGCSTYEIFSCYQQYTRLLSWVTLVENSEGRSVAEAYRKACSDLTETSNCYAGLTRCSENLRANFTRRENGYRALRALVCDTSTLQVHRAVDDLGCRRRCGGCSTRVNRTQQHSDSRHDRRLALRLRQLRHHRRLSCADVMS
ncbi:uncharacterized protein [Dermacentor andersoni]|uniref:uncharacterized protein isoform X2 n=1 Tax=Dermacentor andersoni TaxID=34620 RepID=UPI003B3AB920